MLCCAVYWGEMIYVFIFNQKPEKILRLSGKKEIFKYNKMYKGLGSPSNTIKGTIIASVRSVSSFVVSHFTSKIIDKNDR